MGSILNKKIPTILGIFLLIVGVLATSYLVNTGVIYFGRAAPSENPQNVRITNIADTSFTVTYTTEAKVIGTIQMSSNGTTTQTVLDERDQASGIPNMYNVHSIAVKNAKPDTTYSFSITSGTTTYQNNNQPFTAKTGTAISATPSAVPPLTGKALDTNGNPPQEALVYVTTSQGQSLSALTHSDGIYIIPLNSMRTNSFDQYVALSPDSLLQLLLTNGPTSSQAQIKLSNANPVPIITLGNSYNFVSSITPIASTAASLGFPPFPVSGILGASPIITTPTKNESFTDAQPQFSGKGLPNQTVQIEIHSNNVITASVTTDAYGNWIYRPTTPLSPGQHTLTITTKNSAGILQTIEQSFTVYASGSQVTQTATPSATLAPSPTQTPTTAPTTAVTPTGIITPTSIVTTTPTITRAVTPKPTLPPTGSNALVTTSLLGIATTLVGVVLFVITKGAVL